MRIYKNVNLAVIDRPAYFRAIQDVLEDNVRPVLEALLDHVSALS